MKTRPDPILNSELLAAYRAVRPLLLQEQRPRIGAVACTLAALGIGFSLGKFHAHHSMDFPALNGIILGVFCGGLFQRIGRPIEHKWRWLAMLTAWLGLVVHNLTWSYTVHPGWSGSILTSFVKPGSPRMETTYGFLPLADLIAFTLAGWMAWYFSYRMPTQGDIIQRARQLATR
jgi:hypothetical protein